MKTNSLILLIGTLVVGILNIVYHHITDYYLSLFIAEKYYDIDLLYYSEERVSVLLFNSFYIINNIGIWCLMIFISGYYTTKIICDKFAHNKIINAKSICFLIVTWGVKIPVYFEYSSFPSILNGLLIW